MTDLANAPFSSVFSDHMLTATWTDGAWTARRLDVKHFLLFYDVGGDYVMKRAEFREAHLRKAWAAHRKGELVLAGALGDPVDGAVLLFKGDSSKVAEDFARSDPYVVNGLVSRWRVREWTTVAGDGASTPIRPAKRMTGSRRGA